MTDEDKTGSQGSDEEPTAGLAFAAVGSVLLVGLGVLTFVVGLLSPLITDGCGPDSHYESGEPDYCRHSGTVVKLLTVPVLLVLPAGLLFTWLRFAHPYRPRAWVPLACLAIIAVLWVVATTLLEGKLF
ncbi:hypothetical protein [Actinophytocola sp. NPDC049390]|uniref:hypothetical protein n=1 Tax=Actinophytocola sp. NPDC049390 TaxID=3363894 RepID=UPI0037A9E6AE